MDLFDPAQSALTAAMRGSAARQQALAGNLANVDTPGYVRKDVDFHDALRSAMSGTTDTSSMSFEAQADTSAPVRLDGNTVDVDAESSAMSQNALEYDALASLAEEELGLLAAGRIEELGAVQARRDELLGQLPAVVVEPSDREALARAHAMQVQITALLERATNEMAARIARLDRGRTSVRAYATSLKTA